MRFDRWLHSPRLANRHARPLWLEALEDRAVPATFVVTSVDDTPVLGSGTLREAILLANSNFGPDIIEFDSALAGGTIALSGTPLPTITGDLTVSGLAAELLTVDALGLSRIIQVGPGATVGMSGLTLTGGSAAEGGGIRNFGTLTVTETTLRGNVATGLFASTGGGGIFNAGLLTVTRSTFTANAAGLLVHGGGIFNRGILTVIDSNVSGNAADLGGNGGGIFNSGTLTLTGGTLGFNSVTPVSGGGGLGGGLYNAGILTVSLTSLTGNSADRGGGIYNTADGVTLTDGSLTSNQATLGGGLFNEGSLTMTAGTMTANQADQGGGLYNAGTLTTIQTTLSVNRAVLGGGIFNAGTLESTDSTLNHNSARAGDFGGVGGGLYNTGTLTLTRSSVYDNGAGLRGGGLYNSGTLTVTQSTLSGNSASRLFGAGGALFNDGVATLISSTLSGNSANLFGGAIVNFSGALIVTNGTIVLNRALANGGGITTTTAASTSLNNTMVAGNVRAPEGVDQPDDLDGTVTVASAHNLIGDAATSGGLSDGLNGNVVGVALTDVLDPVLRDHGGPTLTHALLASSPAIDAGSNALAMDADNNPLVFDQRGTGFPRILGGTVDIGAFEAPATNQPPVVSGFTVIGTEDSALNIDDFADHFSDPDNDPLVAVRIESLPGNGTLRLNGTAVSAGQVIAAADLANLVFVPALNFHGQTTFTYTASDGTSFALTSATVTMRILSAAEQAERIAARVATLPLNAGQRQALALNLHGNAGDIGKVQAFLNKVNAFRRAGILTQEQANELEALGNLLLISVSTR